MSNAQKLMGGSKQNIESCPFDDRLVILEMVPTYLTPPQLKPDSDALVNIRNRLNANSSDTPTYHVLRTVDKQNPDDSNIMTNSR